MSARQQRPHTDRTDREISYEVIKLREHPQLVQTAARWFHAKWGIPLEAYVSSMSECLKHAASGIRTDAERAGNAVPQWYLAMTGETIAGGLGVIENDFHDRADLAPNVCAVYVEEAYRCRGIAGELLHTACEDMRRQGIGTLYLVTDHTSFYERYGWEFLCMVQGDGEPEMSRMYVKRSE